jgi:hypothetical protein
MKRCKGDFIEDWSNLKDDIIKDILIMDFCGVDLSARKNILSDDKIYIVNIFDMKNMNNSLDCNYDIQLSKDEREQINQLKIRYKII